MMENIPLDGRLALADARQDSVSLVLGDWLIEGADIATFIEALCPPSSSEIIEAASYTARNHPFIFNRPTGYNPTTPVLHVRSGGRGRGERVGAPLFSGRLEFGRVGDRVDGAFSPYSRRLTLLLSINPTRFVRHQSSLRMPDWQASQLSAPSLFAGRTILSTGLEASLDGSDNILLSRRSQWFGSSAAWPHHLQRYWSGLLDLLHAEFAAAAEVSRVQCRFRPRLNLRKAQTYWEFAATDPTAFVRELEPILTALGTGADARTFAYPFGEATSGIVLNCRSITVRYRSGVRLRVYAKTTRRVRFEVEHDLLENARPLGGSHVAEDEGALLPWLQQLVEDAGAVLTGVFQTFSRQTTPALSSMPPYALLRRISSACSTAAEADALLSLIVNNGVIRIGSRDPLRPCVHALVECEVLERVGGNYVVAPKFRVAIDRIRSASVFCLR